MELDEEFWAGKSVCVTGGTGLLGYQIVRRLLELCARVRVLALPPRRQHPILRESRIELALGDIRDAEVVRRHLAGCDVVFHTAGIVAVWGPALGHVREVHVVGTRNVLEGADPHARVIHTSSVVTVGASRTGKVLAEESPFKLDGLKIDYVHAKRAAEELALESAAAGRDVVVTNPGYLVGPDDFELSVMGRFCSRYWRGQIPVAPPGGFNLVDVRDAALGHLLAAERGKAGRRYILGGENRTFPEFMATLADVGHLQPRALPVIPWRVLVALAGCAELRSRITREQPYPSLQHSRLNRYYWFYRSDRAADELGYHIRPLAESLSDTYRWYSAIRDYRVRGLSHWWMRPASRSVPARADRSRDGAPAPKLRDAGAARSRSHTRP